MNPDPSAEVRPKNASPNRASLQIMAQLFKAFSDATRLQLLQALQQKTKKVGDLVLELGLTQANVSRHLQILFDAKILRREKRGTATYYAINDDFIYPLCELICDKINRDYESREPLEVFLSEDDFSI